MSTLFAILVRIALLVAVIANGMLSSVYPHGFARHAAAETNPATLVALCHEVQGDSADPGIPAPVDERNCCHASCACDFVPGSALMPVAWIIEASTAADPVAAFFASAMQAPASPRPLRPPIA